MHAEGEVRRTCQNGSSETLTPTHKICGGCQTFNLNVKGRSQVKGAEQP